MNNMTDREMLELAAKAAGIRINHWVHHPDGDSYAVTEVDGTWTSLDDDGDALRLAVKLGIYITWGAGLSDGKLVFADEIDEPCGTNPDAATRRAITRAAAEIGRSMP